MTAQPQDIVKVRVVSSVHASFTLDGKYAVAVVIERLEPDWHGQGPMLVMLLAEEWPQCGDIFDVEIVHNDPVSLLCH